MRFIFIYDAYPTLKINISEEQTKTTDAYGQVNISHPTNGTILMVYSSSYKYIVSINGYHINQSIMCRVFNATSNTSPVILSSASFTYYTLYVNYSL